MKTNFCERLISSCETHADLVAMRVVGNPAETYTFAQMLSQIRSVAFKLRNEGLNTGDRVAVVGENHPCWAIAYLAILYAGGVCVPIDPHGEIDTVTNFFEDAEVGTAFISPEVKETIRTVEERLGRPVLGVVWRDESPIGLQKFEDWTATEFPAGFAEQATPASLDDNAVLIYTSGTTGKPKGVLLTHANICAELDAIDKVLEITAKEKVLSLLPLFHAYLQIANLWLASTKGAEVFYLKELSPDELVKAMTESRMTILASVPRLWYLFHKKIFDEVRKKGTIVSSLFFALLRINGLMRDVFGVNFGKLFFGRVHESFGGNLRLAISAGSRFDEDVAIDFHRLGFTIIQGYGLTETSGAATATYIADNRVGSVGKPMLGVEIKISDPDSRGEGEVLIRGPVVFGGYYNNPQATTEAFTDDGWFRSGDLGRFDKDGHLYITGRAKDVIVLPSGKNVHPEDLEVHYLKSALVAEICVLGIEDSSDNRKGAEKLVAVAVPDFEYMKQHGISNAGEAIRFDLDNLGRGLPEYQRVRDYVIRAEPLPRTATRKIKRFELRKEVSSNGFSKLTMRQPKEWTFTESDRQLLSNGAGLAVADAIGRQKTGATELHPEMNLEIDLRLDSLARAEIFARLEQSCGTEFENEMISQAFTVGEVISLVENTVCGEELEQKRPADLDWGKIVKESETEMPETAEVLKERLFLPVVAFLFLKLVYLFCRIFLRMEVRGIGELQRLEKPFLICPNHQSYLDAFVVCSTYPYSVLKDIFHVGASEYFRGPLTSRLASLLNIIPIDPDVQLLKAMRAGGAGLRKGKILNIYPEGERAFDGDLHPFKKGAAILATELGLPIVPVALDGLHKVWARKSKKIRLAKVTVRFGEPLLPAAINTSLAAEENLLSKDDAYERLTEKLKGRIRDMLDEIRSAR